MTLFREYQHVYCVFCRTGAENRLCAEIGRRFEEIRALTAVQEKHRIIDKRCEIDRRDFLPGYLFLYSDERIDFDSFLQMEDIYRILGDEAEAYELQDGDRAFAEWLLRNEGVIGISRICCMDGKMMIRSGPMKYFGKRMIRIDKHTKNALIQMDFMGISREIWLAFEFEDEEPTGKREGECI